jgi:hypothetical protein
MNTIAESGATTVIPVTREVLEVIRMAEQELTRLLQRRAEITRRANALRQMLSGLDELFGSSILDHEGSARADRGLSSRRKGLTQACRLVLREARTPLRARQGCEELQRRFPELVKRHRHLEASVTSVFRRLADHSEARSFLDHEGLWVWEFAPDATQENQVAEGTRTPGQSLASKTKPLLPPHAQLIDPGGEERS